MSVAPLLLVNRWSWRGDKINKQIIQFLWHLPNFGFIRLLLRIDLAGDLVRTFRISRKGKEEDRNWHRRYEIIGALSYFSFEIHVKYLLLCVDVTYSIAQSYDFTKKKYKQNKMFKPVFTTILIEHLTHLNCLYLHTSNLHWCAYVR